MLNAKILLIVIMVLLTASIIEAGIDLPLIEYECYEIFKEENIFYNFVLRSSPNQTSTNETTIINSFDEICKYTKEPTKCYECIVLKKYNAWNNKGDEEKTPNTPIVKIALIIIIIFLVAFIVYKSRKKWKVKK